MATFYTVFTIVLAKRTGSANYCYLQNRNVNSRNANSICFKDMDVSAFL